MKRLMCCLLIGTTLVGCKPSSDLYTIGPKNSLGPQITYADSTAITVYGTQAIGLPASSLFNTMKADDVRLLEVKTSGNHYEYTYDSKNRLVEAAWIGGNYKLWATRFYYENEFITRSDYLLNVASNNGFETVNSSTLALMTTNSFSYDPTTGLGIQKIDRTNPSGLSTTRQTGFNKNGHAIWTEEPIYSYYGSELKQVKRSAMSTVYQRDMNGNIIKSINTYANDTGNSVTDYTYDTKRNPYASYASPPTEAISPANVLQAITYSGSSKTTVTNTYDYRTDDYPSRVASKIVSESPLGTSTTTKLTEFVYNK